MNPLVFLFLGLTLVIPAGQAVAQDRLPSIGGINEKDKISIPVAPKNPEKYILNNEYLEDTLLLQYQISLLERMIQRQSNITRLEKNYIELGVPFSQPKPPKGICDQLPANIPCYRAYPDLYEIILPEVQDLDNLIETPLKTAMVDIPETAPDTPVEVTSIAGQYNWLEMLCGGGVCSAVVVKNDNAMTKRTVQPGDTLEKGTIEILDISSQGVVVKENGKEIRLKAALASSVSPFSNSLSEKESPVSSALENQLSGDRLSSEPQSTGKEEKTSGADRPQESNNEIYDPGPPSLGPTGLF